MRTHKSLKIKMCVCCALTMVASHTNKGFFCAIAQGIYQTRKKAIEIPIGLNAAFIQWPLFVAQLINCGQHRIEKPAFTLSSFKQFALYKRVTGFPVSRQVTLD